ncbi:MAG: S-layer homology domain-containing protein, partial [Oscillospiraceae bacterium]|nr:S-layer homology domain-containing protein [Oscillospiraceae bacterium]
DAWYAEAFARASAAGIIKGDDKGHANPNGAMTREMYFVVLARGLGIAPQDSTTGVRSDGSAWAEGYINALTDKGYVRGNGQGVGALEPVRRDAAVAVLDQTISTYVNEPGSTVQASGGGIALVVAPAAELKLTGGTTEAVVLTEAADGATVQVDKDAKVSSIQIDAENVTLRVAGVVDAVKTQATGTVVSGTGTVSKVETTQEDTGVETKGTEITVTNADGTQSSRTTAAASTSSSSSSSSGKSTTVTSGYVLMNIPYAAFYAGEGVEGVDAVTSATKMKPRTGGLAGGSYHVNADGSDITGVIYPVLVPDMSVLQGKNQITDESSVDITVTNRGTETTTTYEGKDALFEAESYSYYVLSEQPALYKKLSVAEDGSFSFGALDAQATAVSDVMPSVVYHSHHNNFIEITLNGVTFGDTENVSGALVTLKDAEGVETTLALRHIVELWRKTCIGWADANGIAGKTITNVTFFTQSGVYSCDVEIPVKQDCSNELSATFTAGDSLTLSGLPEDSNLTATVQSKVGRGETPVVLAENVEVQDGVIPLTVSAAEGTTYTISLTGDTYAYPAIEAVFSNPD